MNQRQALHSIRKLLDHVDSVPFIWRRENHDELVAKARQGISVLARHAGLVRRPRQILGPAASARLAAMRRGR